MVLEGLLNKIIGMPRRQREQLTKIESQLDAMAEHIIKLLLIPDKENENNWERTVTNCIFNIQGMIRYSGRKTLNIEDVLSSAKDSCLAFSLDVDVRRKYAFKGRLETVRYYKFNENKLVDDVFIIMKSIIETIYNSRVVKEVTEYKVYKRLIKDYHNREVKYFKVK